MFLVLITRLLLAITILNSYNSFVQLLLQQLLMPLMPWLSFEIGPIFPFPLSTNKRWTSHLNFRIFNSRNFTISIEVGKMYIPRYPSRFKCQPGRALLVRNKNRVLTVVVAQLMERSLLTPEICSFNPVIGKFNSL